MPNRYKLRKSSNERNKELDLKYGTLIADILVARGINDPETARRHISGNLEEEHGDPFLMPEMEKSLDRIDRAIEKNQMIAIHADYDCDGIPGAVILSSLFNKIGFTNYRVSIPDRNSEGYGLAVNHVEYFKTQDTDLIITIDLGITAVEAVEKANDLGIDVIITDHHTIPEKTPDAYSTVHPKFMDSIYPNKELCGAGVVYTLARAFVIKYGIKYNVGNDFIKSVVDMAAFATLSDMVELTPENKAIVKEGMNMMRNRTRPGLMALAKSSRVYMRDLTQDDITFMLAPKLNVASRMGSPYDAYKLLMQTDVDSAKEIADKLVSLSNERRKLVAAMVKEARRDIAKWSKDEKDVIVVGDSSWKVGLLGLVASKMTELYDKPAFVWGKSDKEDKVCYKGSCRGNGSVDMYKLMSKIESGVLDEFGGHIEAGGFSVNSERIYDFEKEVLKAMTNLQEENIGEKEMVEKNIDAILPISLLHANLHRALNKLAPFGSGFEEPVFAFKNTIVLDIRNFGTGGAHIEIIFRDETGMSASTYAFYKSLEDFGSPKIGQKVHIIGTLDKKLWQDNVRIRLQDIIMINE